MIPTSNHNSLTLDTFWHSVVYLLIPTSNHNLSLIAFNSMVVVYLLIPTSNHNLQSAVMVFTTLYIF